MSEATLSPPNCDLLEGVLDQLIPPSDDGRLPGAGEAGLVAAIDKSLRRNPAMRPVIEQGLATLAEIVRGRGAETLAALSPADRTEVVKELESKDVAFFITLMFLAYPQYYQDPRVVEALGIEPRAPHPKGYSMRPHDLTLLDPVRRRAKMFREV
jgi:hypothetical protein